MLPNRKKPYDVRLNPNSTYHSILIKKYGVKGALHELRYSNLRFLMENQWLPKMHSKKIAKV